MNASHVYVGPRKAGDTCSISVHVVQINYRPDEDLMQFMDSIVESTTNPATQRTAEPISQAQNAQAPSSSFRWKRIEAAYEAPSTPKTKWSGLA